MSIELDRLCRGPSHSPNQAPETSVTSSDEINNSISRRKSLSKRTLRTKESYRAEWIGNFLVTGATEVAIKQSHLYCRICRKDVLVLHTAAMRFAPFPGARQFPPGERFRLQTPGWGVLHYKGKPLTEDQLEQQMDKISEGPSVVRDHEHPFTEDVIMDEAGVTDPNLLLLTKVTSLVQVLQAGESYALIEKLCSQFVLTAGSISMEVAWNRDEALVSSIEFPEMVCIIWRRSLLFCFLSIIVNGMLPRVLSPAIGWAKAYQIYCLEFK